VTLSCLQRIQEVNSFLISVRSFEPDGAIANSNKASFIQETAQQAIQGRGGYRSKTIYFPAEMTRFSHFGLSAKREVHI
jgi:hypothetical protein